MLPTGRSARSSSGRHQSRTSITILRRARAPWRAADRIIGGHLRDQLLLSVFGYAHALRGQLNIRALGIAPEQETCTSVRSCQLHSGSAVLIDQPEYHSFRIRKGSIFRVHHDARSNSSLIVGDLEGATTEHRSDAIHLDRPRKKAPSEKAHLDLRQQKYEEGEVETRERD